MDENLHIALIQSHLNWENPVANRISFSEKLTQITSAIDLIVLPEMFSTGFTMQPQNIDEDEGLKTLQWMKDLAKEKNAALTGSLVFQENDNFYNRLFFVFPNGIYSTYDKKHTFTLAGEHEVYQSGIEKLMVEYKGFKICPLICYDLEQSTTL